MIHVNNVSKSFFEKKNKGIKNIFSNKKIENKVIDNINLKIETGKIVGLLGMNGAGKTTTIKMISTMLLPDTGSIFIDNMDIAKDTFEAKRKINMITGGERNLYWRLTVKENLEYFGNLYGISSKKLSNQIEKILKITDLTDVANKPVEKLSKGMKQRLQIARGLINDPKYIFLDEPTLGLDFLIAKELRNYIKLLAYSENKGILLTSHYMNEIEELCDYVYVLHNGKICFEGDIKELKKNFNVGIKTKVLFDVYSEEFIYHIRKSNNIFSVSKSESNENSFEILSNKYILVEFFELLNSYSDTRLISIEVIEPTLEDALFLAWGNNYDQK